MVLLAAACTTTTAGRAGAEAAPAPAPLADGPAPQSTAAPDAGPEQPAVVVTASALPSVPAPADARDVIVPLPPARRPAARRGSPAVYGLLIGVAAGALAGTQRDREMQGRLDADCCGSAVVPGALIVGLIGLGVGAIVGALSGPGDSP